MDLSHFISEGNLRSNSLKKQATRYIPSFKWTGSVLCLFIMSGLCQKLRKALAWVSAISLGNLAPSTETARLLTFRRNEIRKTQIRVPDGSVHLAPGFRAPEPRGKLQQGGPARKLIREDT